MISGTNTKDNPSSIEKGMHEKEAMPGQWARPGAQWIGCLLPGSSASAA